MIHKILTFLLLVFLCSFSSGSFKDGQLKYPRVRQTYKDKGESMLTLLRKKQIDRKKLQIYLRAFKREKQIELWGKNNSENEFKLIKTYDVCQLSGELGPKRKQGDLQIPEGFYHIDRFNPSSNFYLSLGINYPNRSDRILGVKGKLGGDIFIHGACVTIGCLPITDNWIKELYVFCIEAKDNGQTKIPVTIFPSKLTEKEYKKLSDRYNADSDKIRLWKDLKAGFDIFNETRQLPRVEFLSTGRHNVK